MSFLKHLFFVCLCGIWGIVAQVPAKPKVAKGVYDRAQLLDQHSERLLNAKIIAYEQQTSTQIVVLTLPSLQGNDIAMYAAEIAQKWGIGQKDKDNGILLLIAKSDRKMFIATGYGVEHLLTDFLAKQIIENELKPYFKKGDFYQGIDLALDAVFAILKGTYKADKKQPKKRSGRGFFFLIIAVVVGLLLLMRNRGSSGGRGGGRNRGLDTGDVLTMIMLGSMGSRRGGGGFSSGGLGGGGFSGGFGGGGFGGGGAGGSW